MLRNSCLLCGRPWTPVSLMGFALTVSHFPCGLYPQLTGFCAEATQAYPPWAQRGVCCLHSDRRSLGTSMSPSPSGTVSMFATGDGGREDCGKGKGEREKRLVKTGGVWSVAATAKESPRGCRRSQETTLNPPSPPTHKRN